MTSILRDDVTGGAPAPPDRLEEHLRSVFGHPAFRSGQREIVESVMAGRDTMAVLPTGGGKSLTYQLPSTLLPGVTLVLSPLIALMKDQTRSVPPGLAAETTVINSSLEPSEVYRRMRSVAAGNTRLVYAAPERLRQPAFLHALKRALVSLFVVDEAHCISQWGHDFRPDYRAVGRAVEFLNPERVLAVTATATPSVQADIERQLGRTLTRVVRPTFRDNLRLSCRLTASEDDKLRNLLAICLEEPGSILIYARSRRKCEEIAEYLRGHGIAAGYYHARLAPQERASAQDRFMTGSVRVMAATVAFGMGVDKQDIRTVVHYNPSGSLENYYQEAGRAGRDGAPSQCILLHSKADVASALRHLREEILSMDDLKHVYEGIKRHVGRIGALDPDAMTTLLGRDADRLRPAIPILEEVGLIRRHIDIPESITVSFRRSLDGEFDPAVQRLAEWSDQPVSALALAGQLGIGAMDLELLLLDLQSEGMITFRSSGRSHLFEILPSSAGVKQRMEALLHTREALAKTHTNSMLNYSGEVCRHAAIARYFGDRWTLTGCGACDVCDPPKKTPHAEKPSIAKSSPYGGSAAVVSRAPAARPAVKSKKATVESEDDLTGAQQRILTRLKAWRTEQARQKKVPPYVIFSDRTLCAIAVESPKNHPELNAIHGIGPKKATEYGDDVLRIVGE